ncbi:MAG: hypothetical protein NUV74_08820 [Candidatus Brocadiaceae bacterium]|nr:hypothetical protein [Candidatus Brocadiaceae bacterium]
MNHIDQLNLFKTRVDELRQTKIVKEGFNSSITVKYEAQKGLHFQSVHPNEEYFRSFLLTFRKFVSEKEPIYLNRIYNICQQYLTNEKYKEYLVKSRNIWRESLKSTGFKLTFNGREMSPEVVMDLWINGYYFHDDIEKVNALNGMLQHEKMLVKYQFENFIIEAVRVVIYVGNVVTVSLKEGQIKSS